MTYKTILLYLDNEEQAPSLIKAAKNIASQHGAHLIGLFVIHPVQSYIGRGAGNAIYAELSAALSKEQIDRMKRIQQIFEKETRNQCCVAEWRFIDEVVLPVAATVIQEATAVDLLILGQHSKNYLRDEITESVLLASPAPVVVVPENYELTNFGEHVLIAWDGKNEVARAVVGAMPILQSAESVRVHHVRTTTDTNNKMDSNIRDMANKLARHGVNIEVSDTVSEKNAVGKALFDVAKDVGVDCIVMGAYGHSKIRSLLLGNTTDYAMNNMTAPLLMWH